MSYTPNRIMLRDPDGTVAEVTRYGQQVTGARHDAILCRFEYSNSTNDVTVTTTGTGTSSNSNSQAVASTGAGVGKCTFDTVRLTAYRPAHEVYFFGSAVFSTGAANTTQRFGPFDDNDGFYFGYSGTTFGVSYRKGGSSTFIAQSSWNKDKCDGTGISGFNLDPTKNNQYKLIYGWLGIAPISFYVYGGESRGWIIVHVVDFTNTQTTPSILSPSSRIRWEVERTSGAGAVTIAVGCVSAGSTQGVHSHAGHRVFAGSAAVTLTAGVETLIAVFRNKTTYQSKTNKVCVEAVFMGASTDGTKNVRFVLKKNATITGGAWTDVNTANSVIDVNTTATFASGTQEMVIPMLKTDTLALDLGAGHFHLELLPGETMTITGYSAAANGVEVAFRWKEYFA